MEVTFETFLHDNNEQNCVFVCYSVHHCNSIAYCRWW